MCSAFLPRINQPVILSLSKDYSNILIWPSIKYPLFVLFINPSENCGSLLLIRKADCRL